MPPPIALLDANVIIPAGVRDVVLTAAERGMCRVRWSEDILAEVERHLPEFIHVEGDDPAQVSLIKQAKAASIIAVMQGAFPDALVVDYRRHIPKMTNDLKDRHVIAAAWQAGADIVTFNFRHFKATDLDPFNLRAVHPDRFLLSLNRADRAGMADVISAMVAKRTSPETTAAELLNRLEKSGLVGFAMAIRGHLG